MLLANVASYLEMWRGAPLQVEHIRIFYLALQTWFGIASGQVCDDFQYGSKKLSVPKR